LAAGIAWAIVLPNITTCHSCPPFLACVCRTETRMPLRVVVAATGSGAALFVMRVNRPARRATWHEA
jgi:hypothetical protein